LRCTCWSQDCTDIIKIIDDRALDDIESWKIAHDKIIEARGIVEHGLALRHGHLALFKTSMVKINVKLVYQIVDIKKHYLLALFTLMN
jgi:hypothetical protein